jgi:hypothetical protein
MLKAIFSAFLFSALFVAACKKDDTPDNTFIINGLHDIDFTSYNGSYLELVVVQASGTQERVTLSVTGVPAGVTAIITPENGTPDFDAIITFDITGDPTGGTYPIRIVGNTASHIKSYDLNLTVPPFNGFTVNGVRYRASYVQRSLSGVYIYSNGPNGGNLSCSSPDPFPDTDGVYTYQLEESAGSTNSMQLSYSLSSSVYLLSGVPGKTATVTIAGGKMSLSIPTVTLFSSTGDQKELSVSASE